MSSWPNRSVLITVLALTMAGCATVRYSSDYDPQVAFTEYRTYDWMVLNEEERAALERINPFLERRLQRAVERELADRGFVRNADDDPDILISVFPIVPQPRQDYSRGRRSSRVNVIVGFTVGRGYGYRYPYGYPYFGYGYPYGGFYPFWLGYGYPYGFWYPPFKYPSDPRRLARDRLGAGTLVVDVIDGPSGELVWRGWADGALLDVPSAEDLDAYVGEVVRKILKSFPPPGEAR